VHWARVARGCSDAAVGDRPRTVAQTGIRGRLDALHARAEQAGRGQGGAAGRPSADAGRRGRHRGRSPGGRGTGPLPVRGTQEAVLPVHRRRGSIRNARDDLHRSRVPVTMLGRGCRRRFAARSRLLVL